MTDIGKAMIIIAITPPGIVCREVSVMKKLLKNGVSIIHLRKPEAGIEECRKLLKELDSEQRSRVVIHDYPQLYEEFSLKGIHVNKNITSLPDGYKGLRTRSCHSFEEVKRYKDEYDYLFLSPVFDSISKIGYKSAFSTEQLQKAAREGIIDEKVVALGGVTFDKIPFLAQLGFGGVAMSGGIYGVSDGENPVADFFKGFL